MKVLDLQCAFEHRFEGWFDSEVEFQQQLKDQQLQCPLCGSTSVSKRLSAPHVNFNLNRQSTSEPVSRAATSTQVSGLPVEWLKVLRELVASTENVGETFAEEARKIHYGESRQRAIRGQATQTETRELLEEGIAVMPLPQVLKEPLH
jgi:hypothetical protein